MPPKIEVFYENFWGAGAAGCVGLEKSGLLRFAPRCWGAGGAWPARPDVYSRIEVSIKTRRHIKMWQTA